MAKEQGNMSDTEGQADRSSLTTPVQFLKGVGPDRAKLLARMELKTAQDLLFFFPRDYKELAGDCAISDLTEEGEFTVRGVIEEVDQRTTASGKTILGVLLRQDSDWLRGTWFNQPYMVQQFRVGQNVAFSGKPKFRGLRWEMNHPRVLPLDAETDDATRELLPIYRLTDGVTQRQMRRIAKANVDAFAHLVPEVFPDEFLRAKSLSPIGESLSHIHFPQTVQDRDRARFRLVYQELLFMQIALAMRRQNLKEKKTAPPLVSSPEIDARIRRLFQFKLTEDQNRAISQLKSDLSKEVPMNRLLQGDVGTGKTVVAAFAMLLAVANKFQAVLMAPTEILAQQHEATLRSMLRDSKVRIASLTGSTASKQRASLQEGVANGEIDLLIATQAVLQNNLTFAKLGLVIIDEQHKFGVKQRAELRQGDKDPHYLVMTATPIPRTIGMTLFGDLETSVLKSGPAGRQPTKTYWATEDQRESWWAFFRKKLTEGRQGFVISPLVDSDMDDVLGAEQELENLANGELADFRLDVLHGRMSAGEKRFAMEKFREGSTQVLIATTAVEVGIDVPNANLMTIENAHRFGLAQLHQLRGRICRGPYGGFVSAFSDTENETSRKRLEAFARTDNGFELAEIDFQLRGPGELFGTKQHGMPPFAVADLRNDFDILKMARDDAQRLLRLDPNLSNPQYQLLRRRVIRRYGSEFELSDVG